MSSARQLLRTLHSLFEKRLDLFLLELKEERLRLISALLLAAMGGICAFMVLALVTLAIIVFFWAEHRTAVLIVLIGLYSVGAVAAFLSLRRRLQRWEAFSATLEQIRKDRECLETKS